MLMQHVLVLVILARVVVNLVFLKLDCHRVLARVFLFLHNLGCRTLPSRYLGSANEFK
jgi:hypothetical protein